MEKLYQELTDAAFQALPEENAIFTFFEFLKDKIPFNTVICHTIDRNDKIFTKIIEYTKNLDIPTSQYQLTNIFPLSVLKKFWGEDYNEIFLSDPTVRQYDQYFEPLKYYPYNPKSSLSSCMYMSEDQSFHIVLMFISETRRSFTEEHAHLFLTLRPLLQQLITSFYIKNAKGYLRLTPNGPLPVTFEEQLRACPDMKEIMSDVSSVAKLNSSVLITGPTGSGKEMIAETIHALSPRFAKPFIRVNCGAIPETLLESELFGHERGAFTGAIQQKKGYFEQANSGTIYLDEIGELSKNAQTRLLRVLENHEIQRVGGDRIIKLDIRVIAATNKNLWEMVKHDSFREDLYYRLNVFPVSIPSLIERKRDIPILIEYFYKLFVKNFQLETPPTISYSSLQFLLNYAWPGNIRQLRHTIERALIVAIARNKKELNFSFLEESYTAPIKRSSSKFLTSEEIQRALQETKGKIQGKNGAAALLGLHPATMRSRMRVLGIPLPSEQRKK